VDGRLYTNVMRALGTDASGLPISADRHTAIPADVDEDDSSRASIRGRSWLLDGAGGLTNAPILRKSAETLDSAGCLGSAAVTERVWFQTDIAMLAATEFAAFAQDSTSADVFPDTLLPTWARTVRDELGRYALENVLQVDVLSELGVDLAVGPRILAAAEEGAITPDDALARRLAVLAEVAGVTPNDVVPDGRWIYLEAEAGEPVFRSERDTPWGQTGAWTSVDPDLVASSLGMGLLRQA